jgi:hypothetical protein
VNIKWGKEELKDLEIDYEMPPMVFMTQLFSLTGVPIERQKIMVKGGMLKVPYLPFLLSYVATVAQPVYLCVTDFKPAAIVHSCVLVFVYSCTTSCSRTLMLS